MKKIFLILFLLPLFAKAQITGRDTVCIGSTTSLTDAFTGGTWSSSNLAVATVGTDGIVTGVAGGVASIIYTTGGSSDTAIVSVLLPPSVTVSVTPGDTVCWNIPDSLIATITGATSLGYSYSTWRLFGSYVGTGNIFIYNPTNGDSISFQFIGISQCSGAIDTIRPSGIVFVVRPLPHAGVIAGADSICFGTAITLTDTTSGGVWLSTNPHDTISGGIVTGLTEGIDTIMYTVTNSCGTDTAMHIIRVNRIPSEIDAVRFFLCGNPGPDFVPLTDSVSGGTWSSSDTGLINVNPVTGEVTLGADHLVFLDTSTFYHAAAIVTYTLPTGCYVTVPIYIAMCESTPSVIKSSAGISFFPNPTTTILTIQSTSQPINQITITNLLGQTVYTNKYNADKIQVDVSTLVAGLYFVKVNGAEVRKFVKE